MPFPVLISKGLQGKRLGNICVGAANLINRLDKYLIKIYYFLLQEHSSSRFRFVYRLFKDIPEPSRVKLVSCLCEFVRIITTQTQKKIPRTGK